MTNLGDEDNEKQSEPALASTVSLTQENLQQLMVRGKIVYKANKVSVHTTNSIFSKKQLSQGSLWIARGKIFLFTKEGNLFFTENIDQCDVKLRWYAPWVSRLVYRGNSYAVVVGTTWTEALSAGPFALFVNNSTVGMRRNFKRIKKHRHKLGLKFEE